MGHRMPSEVAQAAAGTKQAPAAAASQKGGDGSLQDARGMRRAALLAQQS